MRGLHQAIGFAGVNNFDGPVLLYLGNDKAECNAAVDKAIAAKKFARVMRQDHFAGELRKIGQQRPVFARTECGPEANEKHLEQFKAWKKKEAEAQLAAADALKLKGEKELAELEVTKAEELAKAAEGTDTLDQVRAQLRRAEQAAADAREAAAAAVEKATRLEEETRQLKEADAAEGRKKSKK